MQSRITKFLALPILVSLALIGGGIYYLHERHKKFDHLESLLGQYASMKDSLEKALAHKHAPTSTATVAEPQDETAIPSSWIDIQKKVKNTVVQVFAQVNEFNWLEPYKTPRQGEGAGSGFFINNQGHVITNYHVVMQSTNIEIQIPLFGMERFDAKLIGASPERDIALLKVTDEALEKIKQKLDPIPFLAFDDSDAVIRSQEILALGYPLAQSRLKSTLGIVSGRETLGYFGYIQVTTPLNPGNSGGPALNNAGKVVGINSRGVMGAQSVGYIIPINEVKSALNDLYRVPLLRKPTLGCIFTYATPEMVSYLGNPDQGGWYIAKVFDNTLLKKAGLKKDDMLYKVNGYRIDMYGELDVPWSEDKVSLFELLNRFKIGDSLNFSIYRHGKPMEFAFKLDDSYLPPIRTIYSEFEPQATDYEIVGGMVVMPLSLNHVGIMISGVPSLVKYAQPDKQHTPALVITHVLPNSQASRARVLRPGEIIAAINNEKVQTLDDLRKAVMKSKDKEFLTVRTDNNLYGVLSVDRIVKDEPMLSAQYFYKSSPLIEQLREEKRG
ncbi:trypsin-like peptidase domain-containing protein [Candidatus Babeliales bacterium]|nr:trypsin-like peptidase domain-containing protein [Candidatus Babeliales bacterium]